MKKHAILRKCGNEFFPVPCNQFNSLIEAVTRLKKLKKICKHSDFILLFNK